MPEARVCAGGEIIFGGLGASAGVRGVFIEPDDAYAGCWWHCMVPRCPFPGCCPSKHLETPSITTEHWSINQ